jgi:hypothetical protein
VTPNDNRNAGWPERVNEALGVDLGELDDIEVTGVKQLR